MTGIDPLPYESRTPGTLEAGETVLWEAAPSPGKRPPSVRAVFVVSSIVLIVLMTGSALLGMAGIMRPTVFLMLLGGAGVGVAVWALRYRRDVGVTYRVTDLRVMRVPPAGTAASIGVGGLRGFALITRRNATSCHFEDGDVDDQSVVYERTPDAAALQRVIASLPGRTARRAIVRRRPRSSGTMSANMHRAQLTTATVDSIDDVPLAEGETVLWSGRPRVREPLDRRFWLGRLKTVAWLLVPVAVLLVHSGTLGFRFGHWGTTGISVAWIVLGINALTLQPWLDVRRRRRTRYYLTNVRAIEDYRGRTRTSRSVFLDMVNDAALMEHDDGSGDLLLLGGAFNFKRIDDVRALHAVAIDAIRSAGGSAPGEPPAGGGAA